MKIDILSLFPGYFKGPFDESIVKRAKEKGLVEIGLLDIRDYTKDKFRRVDDRPYGGGPGMVMMPQPVVDAVLANKTASSKLVFLSPQGKTLTAKKCRELSCEKHLILLCGHYEGIDERALEVLGAEEISIGDYVLSSGCSAAVVLVDAVVRLIEGVLGDPESKEQDSFEEGKWGKLLDCPHYTRPEVFEGRKVPEVLLSGNHKEIDKWRLEMRLEKTRRIRPDLIEKAEESGCKGKSSRE